MKSIGCLAVLLLFVAQGRPAPGKVNSSYDKTADFKTFQTYAWTAGQPAFDPAAHKAIVAAIDAELAAIGLKKVDGPTGDVTIRYLAVMSTDVDLDKLEAIEKKRSQETSATFSVGRLVIVMEEGKSRRRLWAADGLERLDPSPAAREEAIKRVVARMFETYPTRRKQ